jgi:hypothetical protein
MTDELPPGEVARRLAIRDERAKGLRDLANAVSVYMMSLVGEGLPPSVAMPLVIGYQQFMLDRMAALASPPGPVATPEPGH